jgi:hypothetical protein
MGAAVANAGTTVTLKHIASDMTTAKSFLLKNLISIETLSNFIELYARFGLGFLAKERTSTLWSKAQQSTVCWGQAT